MNLIAYDCITKKINKNKTWINVEKRLLLSREIKFRKYVTISKRFDPNINNYNYYLICTDSIPEDRTYTTTKIDDYGRIKISLKSIWEDTFSSYFEDCNVCIKLEENQDDGEIYLLEL